MCFATLSKRHRKVVLYVSAAGILKELFCVCKTCFDFPFARLLNAAFGAESRGSVDMKLTTSAAHRFDFMTRLLRTAQICVELRTLKAPINSMKPKQNSFETVSKLFRNCYVFVWFRCADSFKRPLCRPVGLIERRFIVHCLSAYVHNFLKKCTRDRFGVADLWTGVCSDSESRSYESCMAVTCSSTNRFANQFVEHVVPLPPADVAPVNWIDKMKCWIK